MKTNKKSRKSERVSKVVDHKVANLSSRWFPAENVPYLEVLRVPMMPDSVLLAEKPLFEGL